MANIIGSFIFLCCGGLCLFNSYKISQFLAKLKAEGKTGLKASLYFMLTVGFIAGIAFTYMGLMGFFKIF